MANADIPIKIEFTAQADQVEKVTKELQVDLQKLGKNVKPTPIQMGIDRANFARDLQQVASTVRPVHLDVELEAGQLASEIKRISLPPLDFEVDKAHLEREFHTLPSGLDLGIHLAPSGLSDEIRKIKLPPVEIDFEGDLQKLISQWSKDLATADRTLKVRVGLQGLDGIKQQLDGLLKNPNFAAQPKGFGEVITQLQAWKTANKDLLASSKELQTVYKSLVDSAKQGLQDMAERSRNLADLGKMITGAFAGVGSILTAAAASALLVAGNFEQLQARMRSVSGSYQEAAADFAFAVDLAAKTPFDVRGLVQGAVTLKGYQQSAKDLLPVAANLAAAMGKSLPDAALVLGKAASGSSEGFESLRNEYAIATKDLLKFGAVEGDIAGQLSHAEKDIDANREALIKLINLRFGDAIERQSATMQGALSNLGDAGEQALNAFGETLLPVATAFIRFSADVVGSLSKIPVAARAMIAGTIVIAGGTAVAAAGVGGLVTALFLLQSQLATTSVALLAEFPAAAAATATAAGLAGGAIDLISKAAFGAQKALAFISANPALLTIAGLAIGAKVAFEAWAEEARKAGDAVSESANKVATVNALFRENIAVLNAAGQQYGVTAKIVGNSSEQFAQIGNLLSVVSPETIVAAARAAGHGVEEYKKHLTDLAAESSKTKEQIELLQRAQKLLGDGLASDNGEFEEIVSKLASMGIQLDLASLSVEHFAKLLKEAKFNLERAGFDKFSTEGIINAFNAVEGPLGKIIKSSKELGTYLDLAKQSKEAGALAVAMSTVEEKIASNAAAASILSGTIDQLITKLADKNLLPEQKEAIKEQIKLLNDQISLEKAQDDERKRRIKERLDAEENAFQLLKAGKDLQLHDELRHIQAMLAIVQKGSEEETHLLIQETAKRKEIREKEAQNAKTALEKQINDARQLVADAKSGIVTPSQSKGSNIPGASYPQSARADSPIAPDVLTTLKKARQGVEDWAEAWRKLRPLTDAQKAILDKFRSDNAMDQQREKTKRAKDALTELVQAQQLLISDSTTNSGKKAAVENAIEQIQARQKLHLVDSAGAQTQINQLTRQKLQLEHAIADEMRAQIEQVKSQERANLDQQVSVLEAQRDAGDKSKKLEKDIENARKASIQAQLDAVDRAKDEEIRQHGDVLLAEEQASLKKQNIMQAETLRRFQEQQKQNQTVKDGLAEQQKAYEDFQKSLSGPLQTFEQAFKGPGAFSLSNFSLDSPISLPGSLPKFDDPFKKLRDKVQSDFRPADARRAQLTQQINEGERAQRKFGQDALSRANGFSPDQGRGGSVTNIHVDGAKFGTAERDIEDLVYKVLDRVASRARMSGRR